MLNISLSYLTIPDASPVQAIHLASRHGFSGVGLRLLPALSREKLFPLMGNERLIQEVVSASGETGVRVSDVELIRIQPDLRQIEFSSFFETVARLGAYDVTVVNDDPVVERLIDSFAWLCEQAKAFGIFLNLEPIPWTRLRSYEATLRVLRSANQDNSAVMIDAFHVHRTHTPVSFFEQVDPKYMRLCQLCDAPLAFLEDDEYIKQEAREARQMPGEGQLDLVDLLRHLPDSISISVEVPNRLLIEKLSLDQRAQLAMSKTKELISECIL